MPTSLLRWLRRLVKLAPLVPAGWLAALLGFAWAASRSRPERPGAVMPVPPAGLPPARIVAVPGVGEMFLRDTGDDGDGRPVLLLLHGWLFPADANWYPVYGPLAEQARVLAVDHRGHGRGLRPSDPFRLTGAADDAAALLRHLGTPPVVAVGYSMGGPIAQLLWRRHPDVVRGLVLCATSATFNVTLRDRLTWRFTGVLQLLLRVVPRAWWERIFSLWTADPQVRLRLLLRAGTPAEVAGLVPWIVGELDRGSAEDVAEAGRELSRYDARDWVGEIDVPVGVVMTTRDQLVPLRNQRDMARRMPTVNVAEVPLDHDAVVAAPDVFLPALRKAVDHVLASAPP